MTKGSAILLRHVRRVLAAPLAGLPDGDLLRKFAAGGADSEPAFEVLVRRHGPMVLSTCRSAMGDIHAADDCFQAAFLVLVGTGRSLRLRGPLGPWLFQVARRMCVRARIALARRAKHEACAPARDPTAGNLDRDMVALIHAEVGRLPSVLRTAVVLCDLGGLSYQEAADRLGLPHATVRGRLARARERLRQRLGNAGSARKSFGGRRSSCRRHWLVRPPGRRWSWSAGRPGRSRCLFSNSSAEVSNPCS
jgi:RNA polymerase sigma factor (sigma-70 family)